MASDHDVPSALLRTASSALSLLNFPRLPRPASCSPHPIPAVAAAAVPPKSAATCPPSTRCTVVARASGSRFIERTNIRIRADLGDR